MQAISSFALYGFPESHAASFALIAYASAYLKCNYLAAFTAAILNNQPMGFYQPFTLIKDAQRHGLKVLPVDITCSDWLCTLEREGARRRCGDRGRGTGDAERGEHVASPSRRPASPCLLSPLPAHELALASRVEICERSEPAIRAGDCSRASRACFRRY